MTITPPTGALCVVGAVAVAVTIVVAAARPLVDRAPMLTAAPILRVHVRGPPVLSSTCRIGTFAAREPS